MENTTPDALFQAGNCLALSGVSQACIARNGICHVDADQAAEFVGSRTPGVIIPYFTFQDGQWVPIRDPGTKPYCRLRKDFVEGTGKYHQPLKTGVHSYIPAELAACSYGDALVVVEGEKKALSTSDHSQGFSVPAIGLPGFYGYRVAKVEGESHHLTAECEWVLNAFKQSTIAFLGDADTALNWQFSHAAVGLRELVRGRKIILPRLPIVGPKGIDDVRQELGSGFEKFFRRLLDDAIELKAGMGADQLSLGLLEPELEAIAKMPADRKAATTQKIVRTAVMMGGEAREQLLEMVKKPLGIGKTELRKIIAQEAKRCREKVEADRLADIRPKVADFFYDAGRYHRKSGSIYIPLSGDQNMEQALRIESGLTGQAPGAASDAELGLFVIQKENYVKAACEIAGYPPGLLETPNGRILVTKGPNLIEGADGDAGFVVEFVL